MANFGIISFFVSPRIEYILPTLNILSCKNLAFSGASMERKEIGYKLWSIQFLLALTGS